MPWHWGPEPNVPEPFSQSSNVSRGKTVSWLHLFPFPLAWENGKEPCRMIVFRHYAHQTYRFRLKSISEAISFSPDQVAQTVIILLLQPCWVAPYYSGQHQVLLQHWCSAPHFSWLYQIFQLLPAQRININENKWPPFLNANVDDKLLLLQRITYGT